MQTVNIFHCNMIIIVDNQYFLPSFLLFKAMPIQLLSLSLIPWLKVACIVKTATGGRLFNECGFVDITDSFS